MKKILKLILLVCVVFSQISSPVKVIAEEILADIPSIETIGITGNADNEMLTVSIDGNNFLIATEDEEPVTTSYIVKTSLTFTYVNEKVETDVNYQLVTGTEINEGTVTAQFENFGYGYNGVEGTTSVIRGLISSTTPSHGQCQQIYEGNSFVFFLVL